MNGVGTIRTLAGCILLMTLGACTFERRADPGGAGTAALTTEDSVMAVVASLDAARRDGDLAAAVGLFDANARVGAGTVRGAGVAPGEWLDPGEALLGERSPEEVGAGFELVESHVEFPSPGTALVLNRYAGDGVAAGEGPALETLVMVRRDGGWRIRHLYRSVHPPPGTRP